MPSLFIDNLPLGFNSQDLRELFDNHRYITDAYVPPIQRSRENGRYGFIEVQDWEEGERLIKKAEGRKLGSRVVKVHWAKFPRRRGNLRRVNQSGGAVEQSSGVFKEQWHRFNQPGQSPKVIKVEINQESLEWLERSITCCSEVPRDIESIKRLINDTFEEKIEVRDLGHYKFILTLESKESKDRMKIEGKERLENWFYSISDWNESDVCQTRRVWIEIVGLPAQFWSESTIRVIAANWGDVVLVENETTTMESMAAAKVLIDTLSMQHIQDEAIIQHENKGFKIFVSEAKCEFTIFHIGSLGKEGPDSAALVDNEAVVMRVEGPDKIGENRPEEIVGGQFDGGEGQADGNGGILGSNLNSNSLSDFLTPRGMGQHRDHQAESGTPICAMDNNRGDYAGELFEGTGDRVLERGALIDGEDELGGKGGMNYEAVSQESGTKTKTADLSGNNYSEEVEKIQRLIHRKAHITQDEEVEYAENRNMDYNPQSESVLIPPGFEGLAGKKEIVRGKRRVKASKGNPSVDKRITRSQVRKGNTQSRTEEPSIILGRSQSIETTNSMKQTAEEALKLGELLGVKVISNWDNAVKRITDTLKENRANRAKKV